jgi:hypothetical protein
MARSRARGLPEVINLFDFRFLFRTAGDAAGFFGEPIADRIFGEGEGRDRYTHCRLRDPCMVMIMMMMVMGRDR